MYIPGYGYGVALDTGGAIKGQKIDLFYDTLPEANSWGRRWVTIQLLGKGEVADYANVDLSNLGGEVAILSFGKTDIEWPLAKDAELYRKYLQLDADWTDSFKSKGEFAESKVDSASGNAASNARIDEIWDLSDIPAEKDQVDPHRVSWSLLASLDKVLGDPVVHGESGLESEGRGRKPNPDKHFNQLRPELTWQTFTLIYYETWPGRHFCSRCFSLRANKLIRLRKIPIKPLNGSIFLLFSSSSSISISDLLLSFVGTGRVLTP
jgi:hypothetical protein